METVYDKSMYQQLQPETYRLQFAQIPIPGIDIVTPEIDVNFIAKNDIIVMKSGNWTLKGKSGLILKDSKFMQTFNIDIKGSLSIDNDKTSKDINKQIVTIGWVEYKVKGLKPKVFRNAPSFLLDKTISFIKTCVTTFVSIQFEPKLLESFRKFTYERLKSL